MLLEQVLGSEIKGFNSGGYNMMCMFDGFQMLMYSHLWPSSVLRCHLISLCVAVMVLLSIMQVSRCDFFFSDWCLVFCQRWQETGHWTILSSASLRRWRPSLATYPSSSPISTPSLWIATWSKTWSNPLSVSCGSYRNIGSCWGGSCVVFNSPWR